MKKLFANLTTYLRQLVIGTVGKILGQREHRTPNPEPRTSKQPYVESAGEQNAAGQILSQSGSSGQSDETIGDDSGEHSTTHPALRDSTFNHGEVDSATNPTPMTQRAPIPATPRNAGVPPASSRTGERHDRGPRPSAIGPSRQNLNHHTETNASPGPTLNHTFITREELKRELDSLRRTLESKGK